MMIRKFFSASARPPTLPFSFFSSNVSGLRCLSMRALREMGQKILTSEGRRRAGFRLCSVSSHTIELLEIQADDPTFHVFVLPGNPGVVAFYKDFIESLHELLGGNVSITAIGSTGQTEKDWERCRLFSLQEQIDHKVDFIRQELQNTKGPVVLVGHSIGAYIVIEVFRRLREQVALCIGLYPFLAVDRQSKMQSLIGVVAESSIMSAILSFHTGLLGYLPNWASASLVKLFIGSSWSVTAIQSACSHLLKYHTMRNVLFMAMTEFRKLTEAPDWVFLERESKKLAFLFGVDDHWGPLHLLEEISKQAPDIALSIEREGHSHQFCCSEDGSQWVAQHVAGLIKNQILD